MTKRPAVRNATRPAGSELSKPALGQATAHRSDVRLRAAGARSTALAEPAHERGTRVPQSAIDAVRTTARRASCDSWRPSSLEHVSPAGVLGVQGRTDDGGRAGDGDRVSEQVAGGDM